MPPTPTTDIAKVKAEVQRCWTDLTYFMRYLQVFDKYLERMVPFVLNPAQEVLHEAIGTSRGVLSLKARQVGSSTYWIARAYWRCIRRPNHQALIVVHTTQAARDLFKIAQRFNDSVPRLLRPAPDSDMSDREIRFPNGSLIRVTTANTESMRGQTYGTILFSEYAFYEHPDATIAAALKTLTPNGEVYLESTANGLNWCHEQWYRTPSAWHKVFLSWRLDPRARAKKLNHGATITEDLQDLATREQWSTQELNWAANTLESDNHGNFQKFCQETPSTPDMAFVTSGTRVFTRLYFPHVQLPPQEGFIEFMPPNRNVQVAMGVDVGTGSPTGDYSAYAIMDKELNLYGTYYGRQDSVVFTDNVLAQAKRYNNALLAIEHPGPGAALQDQIIAKGYPWLYARPQLDHNLNKPQLTHKAGWLTTEQTRHQIIDVLHRNLNKLPLAQEPRLQSEINTFEYDQSGRPGHNSRGHDDLLFATGITMMATEQIVSIQVTSRSVRPRTTEEICKWQRDTGDIYGDHIEFDSDDDRPNFGGLSDYMR